MTPKCAFGIYPILPEFAFRPFISSKICAKKLAITLIRTIQRQLMAARKTIEEIDQQMAQLKALREKITARQSQEKRKNETRKKIILGGFLIDNDPATVEKIIAQLIRPQDLRAFGISLSPASRKRSASPPAPSPAPALDTPEPPPSPIAEPASEPSLDPASEPS